MKRGLLVIAGLLIFTACNKSVRVAGGSTCIKSKVRQFSKTEVCDGSATVKQYTFQGQAVYVFDQGTCGADMAQPVLNATCDTLGFLGGFAGNCIINGENFYEHAVYVSTIWNN